MPLLNSKPFFKNGLPNNYRDDDEVFYCQITNEIFQDYEEFCQRIILVNSMVWTCSKTGKKNLTYAEALDSERKARKNIHDFPKALRIAVLYLASQTQSSSYKDIYQDIYHYIKMRFFVGEIVEVDDDEENGGYFIARVCKVTAPTMAEVNANKADLDLSDEHFQPPAVLYRYQIEVIDKHKRLKKGSKLIVGAENLHRLRGQVTQEKLRLLIKETMVPDNNNRLRVQQDYHIKHINNLKFTDIFHGPLPQFTDKINSKRSKQETMTKFLTTNNAKPEKVVQNKKSMLEEMRKREAELKKRLLEEKEEKIRLATEQKRIAKERYNRIAIMVRKWLTTKDDLLLDDHKPFPTTFPIKTKIPLKYFGDCLMIIDFLNIFGENIESSRYFSVMTIPLLERALTKREVNGPLTDLIRLFLEALFNKQAVKRVMITQVNTNGFYDAKQTEKSVANEIQLATKMSSWIETYQGIKLDQMPQDGLTITEILRLHLLSSGAQLTDVSSRLQQTCRGGYTSEDDPGLDLRMRYPQIMRQLRFRHVTQLSIKNKLRILNCLINQLLTYDDMREIIDQSIEQSRMARVQLKIVQANEKKRDAEVQLEKQHLTDEYETNKKNEPDKAEAHEKKYQMALQKQQKLSERKLVEYQRKFDELIQSAYLNPFNLSNLGMDRAFRTYHFLPSIPALLVERNPAKHYIDNLCQTSLTELNPELCEIDNIQDKLKYMRNHLLNTVKDNVVLHNSSDKENKNDESESETTSKKPSLAELERLLLCTTDPKNCPVHRHEANESQWDFYADMEAIEGLIQCLNPRGIRESELRDNLTNIKSHLLNNYHQCPVVELTSDAVGDPLEAKPMLRRSGVKKYAKANLGFDEDLGVPVILEHSLCNLILDLESQVVGGSLGTLRVRDRNRWRECLETQNYDVSELKMDEQNGAVGDDVNQNGDKSRSTSPIVENSATDTELYSSSDSEADNNEQVDKLDGQNKIQALANALETLAYSVDRKFLNCPLGSADLKSLTDRQRRQRSKSSISSNILAKWRKSLLKCTSYSQLVMHYSTLENSVALNKSVLYAKCITCRKNSDEEKLLLCDRCNRGQHLYCATPKLIEIPDGNWFCRECSKAMELDALNGNAQSIDLEQEFLHGFINGVTDNNRENGHGDSENNGGESDFDEQNDDDAVNRVLMEVQTCSVCKGSEEHLLLTCCDCRTAYHADCLNPPLKRAPRGSWTCQECVSAKRDKSLNSRRNSRKKNVSIEDNDESVDDDRQTLMDLSPSSRRCAGRKAMNRIHGFARKLRRASTDSNVDNGHDRMDDESMSSDEEYNFQARFSCKSKKRMRLGEQAGNAIQSDDLPLHNAPLQELLADILKHRDAWAFIAPVLKRDVPDYFQVIKTPMDFGTIRYKLNMGDYKFDEEILKHILLVFDNCNTYNNSQAEVYKCAVRLFKFVKTRCEQLGFSLPPLSRDNGIYEDAENLSDSEVVAEEVKLLAQKRKRVN